MYEAPLSSIPNHIINIDLNNFIHVKSKMTLEDLETFFATLFLESKKQKSPGHEEYNNSSDDGFMDPNV